MIAAPQDFASCNGARAVVFDRHDADRFVFDGEWTWVLYLRYFDPVSFVRNAFEVGAKRANRIPLDPLVFTEYGDGPLDTDRSRELVYGELPALDSACFDAMRGFALALQRDKRTFTVVTTPLNPEWRRRYDANGTVLDGFERTLEAAMAGTGAKLRDARKTTQFERAAFTDAIHLRWSAVRDFSASIVRALPPRP